ncbi:single-stranded-DNA-specific exonuclease RecJ [Pedobacter heparinus]|uniref:Single-stranded-DNA-specific exonuclease RecJ n=1 Tax=Pedobacter heparinus (strain ATCC 13125 / DSM 2366 / CIP 104194 / JCM 7457 / NBRC 12017 / NCIMB 9290 / NRRL B-14731 / HIM 762-3) TaxID=485917 RepID=C6XU81_PEDHD|nr:single-stranded-DNA-specific exonuclease RecJ [Pedobacter heparinus]ACU05874.1 single-stranded-DNA-specific exonuclease RecJ [Pedobacter heparinus DSM 2366]
MKKRWVQALQGNKETTALLAQQLNIDSSLAQILVQRGISSFEEARQYFRPDMGRLHDPFLMKDMDKAIERIDKAINSREKILVYGDYDVDGTTSVALAFSFFSQFTDQIGYYIPDRHKEGYGISTAGIDYANANGISLIIALDCGIKSTDKIAYANSLNIDFIICDHHLPGEVLPAAVAILDPKRKDCPYPFKELAGCGIGFKLAQAYCLQHRLPQEQYERYLDLVMVSIAADIVPIEDENRILAYHGLIKLNSNPCIGLKALMDISGKNKDYTLTDVVFTLAPRINAAGRMDHANQAVKMLLCTEDNLAQEQSLLINLQNTERKTSDQNMTAEALALIAECEILINKKTTVVYHENWNKGVIGIVASRLTEKYYRPTVVLTKSNGLLTGSARSVAGFDLYEALLGCEDLLVQFGGHKFAAGLTIKAEDIGFFTERFENIVAATITEDLLCPEISIDNEIRLRQIDGKFQRIIAQMAPFGPHNMAPVFVSHEVFLASKPYVVGTKHLKLAIKQQNSSIFECIAFGMAEEYEQLLQPNQPFSVCYTIEENIWKAQKRLQLNIKEIKLN